MCESIIYHFAYNLLVEERYIKHISALLHRNAAVAVVDCFPQLVNEDIEGRNKRESLVEAFLPFCGAKFVLHFRLWKILLYDFSFTDKKHSRICHFVALY